MSFGHLGRPGKNRLLSEARGMAAWLILSRGSGSITELGKVTGRDITTLSTVSRHLQVRAKADGSLVRSGDSFRIIAGG